jgi:hypothetical protein
VPLDVNVDVPLHDLVALLVQVAVDDPLVVLTGTPPALVGRPLRVPPALEEANDVRGVRLELLVHQPDLSRHLPASSEESSRSP